MSKQPSDLSEKLAALEVNRPAENANLVIRGSFFIGAGLLFVHLGNRLVSIFADIQGFVFIALAADCYDALH